MGSSTATSGIAVLVPKLFVIVLIAVIVIFVLMFIVRRQDELGERLDAARAAIVECRRARYQLMCQVIDMFGTGNPDLPNLTKLRDLYEQSDSEEHEIMWEQKYVVIMRRYMDYAGSHVDPSMRKAWEMSNEAVSSNEAELGEARDVYEQAKKSASAYSKPPLSYIAAAGDKAADAMRRHEVSKQGRAGQEGGRDGQE